MIKITVIIAFVLILIEVIALLWLKSQVNRYETFWQNKSEVSLGKNNDECIRYLALGNSAAQGIGATSPSKGYVGLVAKELEARHKKPVCVINFSVTGATLKDFIDNQVPQIKGINADVVTLDIGANDMKNFNVQKFRDEFTTIAKSLPKGTLVANVPYFGGGRRSNLVPIDVQANKIVGEVLSGYSNLVPVDIYTHTKEKDHLVNYAPDYFHPNNLGYKNWRAAFVEKLPE